MTTICTLNIKRSDYPFYQVEFSDAPGYWYNYDTIGYKVKKEAVKAIKDHPIVDGYDRPLNYQWRLARHGVNGTTYTNF